MSRVLWFVLGAVASAVGIGAAAHLMDDGPEENEDARREGDCQEEEKGNDGTNSSSEDV